MDDKVVALNQVGRIVVIDDSEFSRKGVCQTLSDAGFQVVGDSETAQGGIELVASQKANIVIIDVVMPDYNGIELAKYFKDNFSKINIVMISSLAHEHVIIEAIAAGASEYLQKPFNKEDLALIVRKLCEKISSESRIG